LKGIDDLKLSARESLELIDDPRAQLILLGIARERCTKPDAPPGHKELVCGEIHFIQCFSDCLRLGRFGFVEGMSPDLDPNEVPCRTPVEVITCLFPVQLIQWYCYRFNLAQLHREEITGENAVHSSP